MAMPAVSLPAIPRAADEKRRGVACGSPGAVPFTPRQRDRRQALADLVAALTRSLDRRHDISLMRGAFEEWLRRMVPLRTVHLREAGSRWTGRGDVPAAPESVAIEVPGPDPDRPGVLEATFDPACGLGEWDFQMLGMAAHIGALVLEIERSRLQLVRAGILVPNRPPRRDAVAPLVGSTVEMRALRDRIERVAATDFTVLLEGASDPLQ
jgi:hypothetical protein